MSLHEFAMRRASAVLFWISVLVLFATIGSQLLFSKGQIGPYEEANALGVRDFILAIASGFSSAAWPFFGAAAIWTLGRVRPGAAE